RVVRAGLVAVLALSWGTSIAGTTPAVSHPSIHRAATRAKPPAPVEPPDQTTAPAVLDYAPYHGSLESIAWGGHGELRFGYDRTAGVSDPSWFSVGRANGFFLARLGSRFRLGAQAAYDRGADDFVLERAELIGRVGRALDAHAGIFLAPLGRTNLDHDAPLYEFAERSLVATQLVGVPNAELGAGIRGFGNLDPTFPFTYEVDLVTGFDDGVIMGAAGGTRLPAGRNNYGDQNGVPAVAGRIALQPSVDTEIGFAAQSGPYNQTKVGGATVDHSRFVHLVVVDGETRAAGFQLAAEAGGALIDVPPALRALYAQRQWGASVEATRLLRAPLFHSWHGTSLSAGIRADKVDFDARIPGDSRSRLCASLNFRPHPAAVIRFGWYYEWRRDRFNNDTPMAGLTLTAASYF
ncbi:MAG TPA: hypothetical protein VK123_08205, partial [Candidatus Limnocylindrales bacterium]|nr:hypothetical protein [Candidatus Limnocylindrales bacterium]